METPLIHPVNSFISLSTFISIFLWIPVYSPLSLACLITNWCLVRKSGFPFLGGSGEWSRSFCSFCPVGLPCLCAFSSFSAPRRREMPYYLSWFFPKTLEMFLANYECLNSRALYPVTLLRCLFVCVCSLCRNNLTVIDMIGVEGFGTGGYWKWVEDCLAPGGSLRFKVPESTRWTAGVSLRVVCAQCSGGGWVLKPTRRSGEGGWVMKPRARGSYQSLWQFTVIRCRDCMCMALGQGDCVWSPTRGQRGGYQSLQQFTVVVARCICSLVPLG